jgi:hypothetical protein
MRLPVIRLGLGGRFTLLLALPGLDAFGLHLLPVLELRLCRQSHPPG